MRDRKLTGPWAGFSFRGGRLVTPEGRELDPQDLAWLSLTASLAREWRLMMDDARSGPKKRRKLQAGSVSFIRHRLADNRNKAASSGDRGPDAGMPSDAQVDAGPKRSVRG